ncbi:MAG: outer membrane beta-barrel protein [Alphaproteobacteria bacterium]|nr:outer membrane beta-barrel protein [Alphaproteobacteria bacterium]MBU0796825.1 outer membrane beta-barrel protein [Alphaproteobacteria bacterium]MBU0885817.1 outer membrane beta-barrel protein [Alphaproteobacteria bacterium]MBU1812106.1 outer membrane beta-barrel protein [Alphaproteobacteria bacterium]MBU2091941.1 outer membrane beta-barrel protein [Alphaproteobacteria bacterium]
MANPAAALEEGVTEPSLQPKGIELNDFMFFPSVELDQIYTDNLFAEENNANSDWITIVRPAFKLQSRLPQHAVNLVGSLEAYRHWEYTRDDHENYSLAADGRYDLSVNSELNAQIGTRRYYEDRGSDDDVRGETPTEATAHTLLLGGKTRLNRFLFGGTAQAARLSFGDVNTSSGVPINNSDRDRWEYTGQVTGGYELVPGYSAQTAFSANSRIYDDEFDDFGLQRDSKGWRAEAGLGLDLGQVLRGDLLVGYMKQYYEDDSFADISGPSIRATLNWSPTRMTLIVPSLERSILETTILGASGIVRTAASLSMRHELQRNLIGYGYVSYYNDDFENISGKSNTFETRWRLMYALTDNFYTGLQASYRDKESDFPDGSFKEATVGVRFGVQM